YGRLVLLTPLFFPETFTREGLLGTTLFAGFHVVAVLFDLFDDVFRLHFPFKPAESIFQRLTLLNNNFCHAYSPPSLFLRLDLKGYFTLYCSRMPYGPAIAHWFYRSPPFEVKE